jgi:hypothetical protein
MSDGGEATPQLDYEPRRARSGTPVFVRVFGWLLYGVFMAVGVFFIFVGVAYLFAVFFFHVD